MIEALLNYSKIDPRTIQGIILFLILLLGSLLYDLIKIRGYIKKRQFNTADEGKNLKKLLYSKAALLILAILLPLAGARMIYHYYNAEKLEKEYETFSVSTRNQSLDFDFHPEKIKENVFRVKTYHKKIKDEMEWGKMWFIGVILLLVLTFLIFILHVVYELRLSGGKKKALKSVKK